MRIEYNVNNKPTGYAFVEFQSEEDYDRALHTDLQTINE